MFAMRRLLSWFVTVLVAQHRKLPHVVRNAVMIASQWLTEVCMCLLIPIAVIYLTLVGVIRAFWMLTADYISHLDNVQLMNEWHEWQWHQEHDQALEGNEHHLPGEYD